MSTPADWYPDPDVPGGLRYWDGSAWTEHRHMPEPANLPAVIAPAEIAVAAPLTKAEQRTAEFERRKAEHAAKNSTKTVSFSRAVYLGGLPHDSRKHSGNLYATSDCIGIGTFGPKKGVVPWPVVDYVTFGSEAMGKNNAGAVILFGVLGGLAAKNQKNEGIITVVLNDGSGAVYQVEKTNGSVLRGKLGGLLAAVGVPIV